MLLSYDFSTSPSPLQASTDQSLQPGRVNISVSVPDGGETVYCNHIVIRVPVGLEPTDFTYEAPESSWSTGAWTGGAATIGPGVRDSMLATYVFTPVSPDPDDWAIDGNLVFGFDGNVNDAAGGFELIIQETSGTQSGSLKPSEALFPLAKATPEFYLQNLVAVAPGTLVPASEFAAGAAILVEWESNGTWFELYAKGVPAPIYAGTETSFQLPSGYATDTTLILVAAMTGNPSDDQPSPDYTPIYRYDSLTLTVSNPALRPASVSCSGEIDAASLSATAARVDSLTASDTSTDMLTVDGTAGISTVSARQLSVSGPTTLSGAVMAQGVAELGQVVAATVNAESIKSSGAMTIGQWVIQQDGSGNLVFTGKNGASFTIGSTGGAWVGGDRIVASGDPVNVYSPKRNASLNATSEHGSGDHANGWRAWTYWMNNPDGDSNLTMYWGTV